MGDIRYHELDTLRGIAALIIAVHHMNIMVFHGEYWTGWQLFYTPLYYHRAAVLFFFLLSGFVLALPYARGRQLPYKLFVIRRLCRIYLPFLAMVGLSALALWLTWDKGSRWNNVMRHVWRAPVDADMLRQHVLMTGVGYSSVLLFFPAWSLIIEMRVSLMFPLLVKAVKRAGVPLLLLWGALCYAGMGYGVAGNHFYDENLGNTVLGTFMLTFYYIFYFFMGILLALNLEALNALVKRFSLWQNVAVLVGVSLVQRYVFRGVPPVTEVLFGIMGAHLLLITVNFPVMGRLLRPAALRWLGTVSYSMYLTHVPVFMLCFFVVGDVRGRGMGLLMVLACLVAADVFNRAIEKPAMRLGKKLGSRPAA